MIISVGFGEVPDYFGTECFGYMRIRTRISMPIIDSFYKHLIVRQAEADIKNKI